MPEESPRDEGCAEIDLGETPRVRVKGAETEGLLLVQYVPPREKHPSPLPPPPSPSPDPKDILAPERKAGVPVAKTETIRELLNTAFNDQTLIALCFDHFHDEVYEDFVTGMTKGQKIQTLLDYCTRREKLEELLKLVQKYNPDKYKKFEGQLWM